MLICLYQVYNVLETFHFSVKVYVVVGLPQIILDVHALAEFSTHEIEYTNVCGMPL